MSSPTFLINFSAPHLGPQMEWIFSTLSENNHTFLVCCGLWHEKPTFVAFCGLMCPQNHTCVARCGLVVASRACFPCKISRPDPRTTRNFRHFRQGFKRLGRHFSTPQYWDGIWSQSEASSNKASNTIPQYWEFEASLKSASIRLQIGFPNTGTVLEASLKSASIRLQMRFPNTGTGFEAEETRDFKNSKWTSNHEKSCWVSHWPRDAAGRILVRGLLQVTTFRRRMKVSSCIGKKCTKACPSMHGCTRGIPSPAAQLEHC